MVLGRHQCARSEARVRRSWRASPAFCRGPGRGSLPMPTFDLGDAMAMTDKCPWAAAGPHTRTAHSKGSGSLTEITERCTQSSRFVTLDVVTVPGKGGRPRKWRSDADRVRAYRARQAGRGEPPELAEALANGDELARAMEQVRALKAELVAAADTEQALRQEVRSLRRELASSTKRFGWLERASDAQRTAREAERERDSLALEVAELRARARVAVSGTRPVAAPSPAAPTLSRAERRRQEREQQRRRG